jgi:hypothetical protein
MLREALKSIDDKYVNRRLLLLPGRMEAGLKQLRAVVSAMRRGDSATAEQLPRESIRSQR